MMVVGGVFGGFNVRAEPRIWGAPHQGAGREQEAGQGLAEAKMGRTFRCLIFLIFAMSRHGDRPCTFFKNCGF